MKRFAVYNAVGMRAGRRHTECLIAIGGVRVDRVLNVLAVSLDGDVVLLALTALVVGGGVVGAGDVLAGLDGAVLSVLAVRHDGGV